MRAIAIGPILAVILVVVSPAVHAEFDHGAWNEILREYVVVKEGGRATAVNYAALLPDRPRLRAYLDELSAVSRQQFDSWGQDEQLAFLINAYNAWTVDLILSEYPDIDSIRDIGFLPGAAWRRDIVSLFGSQVSLDDVEHGMIRGWGIYSEPRIHFAVNCAAIGCPALRSEAYTGDLLQQQLQDNTELFLSDRDRNYLEGDSLYVSKIFDWYGEDFERGWNGSESLTDFLISYADALGLDASTTARLRGGDIRIRFLRYDWGLNDSR